LNQYGNQFQQLDNLLQGNPTQADAEWAAAQVEKYHSAVTTQMSDWQASMKADDAIISTLQGQQSIWVGLRSVVSPPRSVPSFRPPHSPRRSTERKRHLQPSKLERLMIFNRERSRWVSSISY